MDSFNTLQDRKNTRSVKWDALENVFNTDDILPMWVADMDFKAPQAVNYALIKRAEHGIYGYTFTDSKVRDSIVHWIKKRFDWDVNEDWLSFSPGVVTTLHMAIQTFTNPGDNVLIQTPVYPPFYHSIESHGRNIIKNPLHRNGDYYKIDFKDFRQKLEQDVKVFLLCSPHNPVGRVWKREELQKMAELCLDYNVLIISDEIHADLILDGYKHTPIASLSKEIEKQTITCMAPSKTFNLAGLQASYYVIKDSTKRREMEETFSKQGISTLNTMGNIALEAAYRHGEPWLESLLSLLKNHQQYVIDMFATHVPELKVIPSEGTYLLWIDCSELGMNDQTLQTFMIEEAKVGLNAGSSYGEEGKQFMRMNIACPRQTLEEGVKRIIHAVKNR